MHRLAQLSPAGRQNLQQDASAAATVLTRNGGLPRRIRCIYRRIQSVGGLRRGVVLTATFLLGATLVTAGMVLTTNSASAATPVTVVASVDSYVDAGAQAASFGTDTALRVDGDPQKVAYLKFNIPSGTALTGSVVKLRFFAETSHTAGVTSYSVANAWTETEITYENAPKPDATAGKVVGD
jgi:hypothetical protein